MFDPLGEMFRIYCCRFKAVNDAVITSSLCVATTHLDTLTIAGSQVPQFSIISACCYIKCLRRPLKIAIDSVVLNYLCDPLLKWLCSLKLVIVCLCYTMCSAHSPTVLGSVDCSIHSALWTFGAIFPSWAANQFSFSLNAIFDQNASTFASNTRWYRVDTLSDAIL